jgi:hypothetical protein
MAAESVADSEVEQCRISRTGPKCAGGPQDPYIASHLHQLLLASVQCFSRLWRCRKKGGPLRPRKLNYGGGVI